MSWLLRCLRCPALPAYINELAIPATDQDHLPVTSQFERHLRSVLDLLLGDTSVLEALPVKNTRAVRTKTFSASTRWRFRPRAAPLTARKPTSRKIGHVNISGTVVELRRQATAPRMPLPFCVTAAPRSPCLAGAYTSCVSDGPLNGGSPHSERYEDCPQSP